MIITKSCKHGTFTYLDNDSYVGRSLDLYGEFSEGETELFQSIVKPGQIIIDAGANIGYHTITYAKLTGPDGRVIAFEPQMLIFYLLCSNIVNNDVPNSVIAFNQALGKKISHTYIPELDYSQEYNFGGVELVSNKNSNKIMVNTIDDVAIAFKKIDFIKIDVEGAELQVLQGATKTIKNHRPILFVENDRIEKSIKLIAYIAKNGYDLWFHLADLYKSDNFFENKENVFGGTVSINMLCTPREMEFNTDKCFRPVRNIYDYPISPRGELVW